MHFIEMTKTEVHKSGNAISFEAMLQMFVCIEHVTWLEQKKIIFQRCPSYANWSLINRIDKSHRRDAGDPCINYCQGQEIEQHKVYQANSFFKSNHSEELMS